MSDEPVTPPEASRDSARSSRGGIGLGPRPITKSLARTTKRARDEAKSYLPIYEEYADQRPKTRGDCVDGPRPCVWTSCKYNNYLDVKTTGNTAGMSIVFNFPDLEPEEVDPQRSCALDIADMGGASLEDVAKLMNLTRERIRQVQEKALKRAQYLLKKHDLIDENRYNDEPPLKVLTESSLLRKKDAQVIEEEPQEDTSDDLSLGDGDAIDFLSEHPRAETLITSRVWRIYLRTSKERAAGKRIDPEVDRAEDLPLPVPVAPRHNVRMATKKKSKQQRKQITPASNTTSSLSDIQQMVFDQYRSLLSKNGVIPNNQLLVKATKLSPYLVSAARKRLNALGYAAPSPRGATPKKWPKGKRKSNPKDIASTSWVMNQPAEHQQLPDDVTQSAAQVLALPRGPLADAANAIRNEIINVDVQRAKLVAALNALGELT